MEDANWGPWTEHAPGPCPVMIGDYVQMVVKRRSGKKFTREGYVRRCLVDAVGWHMRDHKGVMEQCLRYRVRRYPQAIEKLREIARSPERKRDSTWPLFEELERFATDDALHHMRLMCQSAKITAQNKSQAVAGGD